MNEHVQECLSSLEQQITSSDQFKQTLKNIRDDSDFQTIEFLRSNHSLICSKIATNILIPTNDHLSKNDISELILPIFLNSPIQAIRSILNASSRLRANIKNIPQREITRTHVIALVEIMSTIVEGDNFIEQSFQESTNNITPKEVICSTLSTLPDNIQNELVAVNPDASFTQLKQYIPNTFRNYYKKMSKSLCQQLTSQTLHMNMIADIFSTFCKRGHTEHFVSSLLSTHVDESTLYYTLSNLNSFVIENVLISILFNLDQTQETTYYNIFAKLIHSSSDWKHVITFKLPLRPSTFTSVQCTDESRRNVSRHIKMILSMVDQKYNLNLVSDTLQSTSQLWKSHSFIKQSSLQQHTLLTYIVLSLLTTIDKTTLQQGQLISNLIQGVQNRLQSTVEQIREHTAMVAMKFSTMMDNEKTLILFEAYKDSLQNFEDSLSVNNNNTPINNQDPVINQRQQQQVKKNIEKLEINPDELFLDQDNEDDESEEHDDEKESDNDDDDVSIQSFNLQDDENDLKQVQPPQYAHQLLQMIRTDQQDENANQIIQIALEQASHLIRSLFKDPNQINNISLTCIALCKSFLFIENPSSSTVFHFETLQFGALVSLVVTCTQKSVKYLCDEFYSTNVTVYHRLLILDVLKESALELSNRSLIRKQLNNKKENLNAQVKPLEKNTRRWGSTPKQLESNPNLFLNFSHFFFYSVLREYHNPKISFFLYGDDVTVLSRLIHCCGVFVYCCGGDFTGHSLAKDMLEICISVRYYFNKTAEQQDVVLSKRVEKDNTSVRRSVLTAILHSLSVLPSNVLIESVGLQVVEHLLKWMIDENINDPDLECREIASDNISMLKSKLN
ncbi:telomere length regulation protein [Acrasis kona]|uniref:Telomere length regulation protein n=1 Tax=Acrasis kona TaxID=1008807 RepID=A0AAW2YMI0_9EUKA